MESFVVMGSIWAMCAFCAVLFVRGASTPDARRVTSGPVGPQESADATLDRGRNRAR